MLLAALLAASAIAQPLLVRKGEASIMPPEPLPLGGYTARAEKPFAPGGDDLRCRVVLLQERKFQLAIVSVEMLTIPESLYREVKKRVPPDAKLFLTATHTHCAPDSQMLNDQMKIKVPGIATFKPKWLEWYADRIALTVRSAMIAQPRTAASMVVTSANVALNHSRRKGGHPDPEESWVAFEQRSSTESESTGDNYASGIATTKITYGGGWYHFSAHPVFYDEQEMHTRGDWPGRIAARLGVLVLQGAIGDISPSMPAGPPEQRLADFVQAALDGLTHAARMQEMPTTPAEWAEVPIKLDPVVPHPDFAKNNKVPEALAKLFVTTVAPKTGSIHAFRIGKLAVVGVCGEPSGALGWRIRNYGLSIGFSAVQVVSHVNGWIGYILEPDDYDRGGYEATLGFHGRMAGERVVDAAKQALRQLALRGKG